MTGNNHNPRRTGFTLVELLVVISIIAVLLGIGAVAITAARRGAIQAGAQEQLNRISNACDAFRTDFQDYPPLVTIPGRGPEEQPGNNERLYRPDYPRSGDTASQIATRLRENRYASPYSLAVYLVGVGDLNGDGVRNYSEMDMPNEDDGLDGPGYRAIGRDKFWGLASDPNRDAVANSGRTYGPYLAPSELGDLLVEERTAPNATTGRFVINDPFGVPVVYYRHWPVKDEDGRASLARIPAELRSLESLAAQYAGNNDEAIELDRVLLGADAAIVSSGLDNSLGGGEQDLDEDLDLSVDVEYARLRTLSGDNLKVFK